jgi:hypothetical protein
VGPSRSPVLWLIQMVHPNKQPSCPDLFRASTDPPSTLRGGRGVDGRDKPGHDDDGNQ